MFSNFLNPIYEEYLPRYNRKISNFRAQDLEELILSCEREAKNSYKSLSNPKTCSFELYSKICVRQILEQDLSKKTLKVLHLDNPGENIFAQALSDYFRIFPPELIYHINKEIYDAPYKNRERIFYGFELPLAEMEKKFKILIEARSKDVIADGYSSFLNFSLDVQNIPMDDFEDFVENVDKFIYYCNSNLPKFDLPNWFYKEFNTTCFYCRMPDFPFKSRQEVTEYMFNLFPVLKEFKNKILIIEGKNTKMQYNKNSDTFEITLETNNIFKHELVPLIHELCHVLYFLESYKKSIDPVAKGKYLNEFECIKKEADIIKSISVPLYQAFMGTVLLTIRRSLFEVEMFKNPNRNLCLFYANIFNRCFLSGQQVNNPQFFLDEHFVLSPMSSLKYSVANYKALKMFMD